MEHIDNLYPGGPYSKTPRGGVIPILSKAPGWISGHSATYIGIVSGKISNVSITIQVTYNSQPQQRKWANSLKLKRK